MTYRKFGLGLLISAVGLMAFAATAQAANPGYLIGGAPVGTLTATATGSQIGDGYLLVAALNLELRCKKFSVQSGNIDSNTVGLGKLLYEECAPLEMTGLGVFDDCEIPGGHVSAEATLLPAEILTTNAFALLAEKIKATILIHSPEEECVLPESNTVKGELCLVIDDNNTTTPDVLASSTIQSTCKPRTTLEGLNNELPTQTGSNFKDQLLYGAQTANVDGTATLSLTGAHAGKTLGVALF